MTTRAAASSIGPRRSGGWCDQARYRKRSRAKTNISRTKAEQAVETVFESLKNAMGRGQRIELRKFGVFSVKPRKTGIGRNPRTGEEVSIPPGKAVRFKPGKELQGLEDTTAASETK